MRDSDIDKIMSDSNIKIIANKQFWLNARDFLHGAFISVGLSVLTVIQNSIADSQFTFKWKNVLMVAIGSFITYLLKNFFTPSNATIQMKTNDPKEFTKQLKNASSISIDKAPGENSVVSTSVG